MRRIGAILFALVLCLVWGSSVLAAPQEATGAATIGLERFKELMAPNADRMGLTKEALQAANLGPGYQVVSWTPGASGKGRKPDMAMAPMGNDTWVYQVLSGTDPVMLLWVVKTPDGWQHARIEQVGPDRASALQDGIGALRAHGLTHSGEPQYFTFRGLNFWVLRVGEKQFMYSAMAQNQPTLAGLGIDRNNIHQSETVLTKLQSLPVSEESSVGGGAGGEVHYVSLVASALGGIVVGAAGIYAFLRRRAHRVT